MAGTSLTLIFTLQWYCSMGNETGNKMSLCYPGLVAFDQLEKINVLDVVIVCLIAVGRHDTKLP